MILKEEEEKSGEKAKASIFYIAYTKNEVEDFGQRPITFSFNGGPGSSSVWLHLGVLGPRRVQMGDVDNPVSPPYQMVDNEYSLLDKTDLVFIDPVGTGYSRPVPGEEAKQFYSVKKDVKSVGEFIRLFTTRYERWSSPKFLIGESYGTTRAAELSGYLQERHGMYFNGIMLVSSVLDFQSIIFSPGNDMPYLLFLPSFTATAWYHKRLPDRLQSDFEKTLNEVENFALTEYAGALLKGSTLPDEKRKKIVKKLADYTGLSPIYIEETNLRPNIYRFVKELLRDERRTVGRLDSRFTGIDRDAAGEKFEFDPSYSAIQGSFTAVLNDYVRRE
jgi:carboxypeptidase C (cathepsin A)